MVSARLSPVVQYNLEAVQLASYHTADGTSRDRAPEHSFLRIISRKNIEPLPYRLIEPET
jgi:hypothetical protein